MTSVERPSNLSQIVVVTTAQCGCELVDGAEKLLLGLPSTVTVIKDLDDAAAVAAARARAGIATAPLITHTAATPQDSPKDHDVDQMNNGERGSGLQLCQGSAVLQQCSFLCCFPSRSRPLRLRNSETSFVFFGKCVFRSS